MLGIALSSNLYQAYFSMALIAIGLGLFLPTIASLIIGSVSVERRGWVLGVNQSVSALSRILGPAIAGILFEFIGKDSPYIFGFIILLVTILFYKKIFIK